MKWDKGQGTNNWYSLIGENPDSLSNSFTVSGLVTGRTYKFKYRAWNAHGFGEFSDEVSIIAAVRPSKPTPIITQNDNQDLLVWWSESNNGGTPITSYVIEFRGKDNSNWNEHPNCMNVYPALNCRIPLIVFKTSPYNYLKGDVIIGRVWMINVVG